MCGRYSQKRGEVEVIVGEKLHRFPLQPRFNIAPSQPCDVILAGKHGPEAARFQWGLIPSWSKDNKRPHINARSETVFTLAPFRGPIKHHRCLVPASGWYEWQTRPDGKQPFNLHRADDREMFFAGIWDLWETPTSGPLPTFAILTRPAAPEVKHVHDRMPVILDPDDLAAWLEGSEAAVHAALDHALNTGFATDAVTREVNSARTDSPDFLKPVALPPKPPEQQTLL